MKIMNFKGFSLVGVKKILYTAERVKTQYIQKGPGVVITSGLFLFLIFS